MRKKNAGFTMLELSIVVLVLTVLASIAIPQMASAIQKAKEGGAKGDLGALRGALAVYNADTEGQFPSQLTQLNGTYIGEIPKAKGLAYHADSSAVSAVSNDSGGWLYHSDPTDQAFGTVSINCTHADPLGKVWANY